VFLKVRLCFQATQSIQYINLHQQFV